MSLTTGLALRTKCNVCPHSCDLGKDEIGKCCVRKGTGTRTVLSHYGQCSLVTVEGIEKRPLFHFYPGSRHLSVGGHGCPLDCKFCQNYLISQGTDASSKYYSPVDLVSLAHEKQVDGISFTFNEPLIHYEYIEDVCLANMSSPQKLPVVVKTNGFVNRWVVRDNALLVDAYNVDIKGDEQAYRDICSGGLSDVMDTVECLVDMGAHVEISYLVLPSMLGNVKFHKKMRNWVCSLSQFIPVHILYFYPFYNLTEESYEQIDLMPILDLFREKLRYVYISNIHNKKDKKKLRNTVCSECKTTMIDRTSDPKILKLKCCNRTIRGVFEK